MALAWHFVWTAYGWWFPNDPRGSWSKEVWAPTVRALGNVDKPGRRVIQPAPAQLQQWLAAAQKRLKHSSITLDANARKTTHSAIMDHVKLHQYPLLALAVMPEHVHIVAGTHGHGCARMVQAFKSVASRQLRKYFGLEAALPATRSRRDSSKSGCATRAAGSTANQVKSVPIWSRGYWVRYLDMETAVAAAVAYVKRQSHNDTRER